MSTSRVPRSTPPRRVSRGKRWASLALGLGLVLGACSTVNSSGLTSSASPGSGPLASSSPASSTRTSPEGTTPGDQSSDAITAPEVAFDVAPVEWRACGGAECAGLEVPLDYQDPTGPTITIAMARLAATGSAEARLGSIFVNFGGPGGEGTETIQSYESFIPDSLRQRFDIVSWDPRGVEDTSGLGCDEAIGDEPTDLVSFEDGFDDDVAADTIVWDRVMECVATSPVVDDLGTVAVVNDLEMMRRAVGDEALTYLGFSYGTEIGWVYATLYPDVVRAMVLDGAVPPSDGLSEQTFSQLVAINDAIVRWGRGCEQSPNCPLRDEGYEQTILRLMDELEADPIELSDGTTFGPVDLGNLVVSMTYLDQTEWGPVFVDTVAALDAGDLNPILEIAASFEGGSETATFWSVLCADGTGILSDSDYESLYAEALNLSPIVGQLPGGLFCDRFPGEIDGLPTLDTNGTPPLIVIGNTGDNATPYADSVLLDQLLANSVLVTYDGPGHTITFSDACVDQIVVDYFVDLSIPAPGTRCGNASTVGDGWFVPIGD